VHLLVDVAIVKNMNGTCNVKKKSTNGVPHPVQPGGKQVVFGLPRNFDRQKTKNKNNNFINVSVVPQQMYKN